MTYYLTISLFAILIVLQGIVIYRTLNNIDKIIDIIDSLQREVKDNTKQMQHTKNAVYSYGEKVTILYRTVGKIFKSNKQQKQQKQQSNEQNH